MLILFRLIKNPVSALLSGTISDLLSWPLGALAWRLYRKRQPRVIAPGPLRSEQRLKVVCISDTHSLQPALPGGDLLIHAGDLTECGSSTEVQATLDWLAAQTHTHKVAIGGNHDLVLDPSRSSPESRSELQWHSLTYLHSESTTLHFPNGRSVNVYGDPFTRRGGRHSAFKYNRGSNHWYDTVPIETEVLVTHMPPRYHLDKEALGDEYLLEELERVKPTLHVCGHVHRGHGRDALLFDEFQRCYEDAIRGPQRLRLLARMALWLWRTRKAPTTCPPGQTTLLINAAILRHSTRTPNQPPEVVYI